MGAKITITGKVSKIRVLPNTILKKGSISCLEIKTAGSPNLSKGLPMASTVHYTVMVNDKQYNRLQRELKEHGLKLRGGDVLVQGEINLDMPLDVVEGEIGVIAYKISSLDVDRIERDRQKQQ